METRLMTITPEMAKEWMTKNADDQRRIVYSAVNAMVRDIRNGNWKVTHQGIAFNKAGKLIDGQHRLTAITLAGIPVQMYVTKGVSNDAFVAIDSGRARSTADSARILFDDSDIRRNKNAHAIARAMKVIITREWSSSDKVTKTEIYDAVKEYSWALTLAVDIYNGLKLKRAGVVTAIIAALACGEKREDIDAFIACINKNDVSMSGKYNCKAALDVKQQSIGNGGSGATRRDYEAFRKALYLFIHNVKFKKNKDFYEISGEQLKQYNEELKRRAQGGHPETLTK